MHAHAQQQKANAARSSSDASAAGDGASSSSSKPASDLHNLIPPTVVDQIYLWEKERNRFNFVDGVLYNQFLSQGDFETVRKFAESQEVWIRQAVKFEEHYPGDSPIIIRSWSGPTLPSGLWW